MGRGVTPFHTRAVRPRSSRIHAAQNLPTSSSCHIPLRPAQVTDVVLVGDLTREPDWGSSKKGQELTVQEHTANRKPLVKVPFATIA